MTTWDNLWKNPEIAKQWADFPPLPEVVEMADRLQSESRRRLLDIGCGLGRHTVYLAARGFQVTATDSAPTAISACRDNLARAALRATLLQLDMADLPFPDAGFDGVISSHVIHHARRAAMAAILDHITLKLSPHGYFAWAMPTRDHFECGLGQELEPGTWVNPEGREGPLPHHYCTEEEVYDLLRAYELLSLRKVDGHTPDGTRSHWRALARKL